MFYVYVDWTEEETPRPFYVGKGNMQRVGDPLRNPKHAKISHEFGHQRRIVYETQSESEALAEEARLTLELKTIDGREGHWGANFVVGGAGSTGTSAGSKFQRHACVHVKLDQGVHKKFRAEVFKAGTSMQMALEVFASAFASGDPHLSRLVSEEKKRRQ